MVAAAIALGMGLVAAPAHAGTPATGTMPAGGMLGDFNNDSLPDIVAINPAGNLMLYLNSGQGPLDYYDQAPIQIGTGWSGYTLDAVYNLDNSTQGPGILATTPNGTLVFYENVSQYQQGDYELYNPVTVGTGWSGMKVVGVTQLSGYPIGILAIDPQGNLRYYPQQQNGSFSGYEVVGTGWNGYTVDWAGSPYSGLLAVDPQGRLWFYSETANGTGEQTFSAPTQVGSGWNGFKSMDVASITSFISADILAIDSKGDLVLYPNTEVTNSGPVYGAPSFIGYGWTGYQID